MRRRWMKKRPAAWFFGGMTFAVALWAGVEYAIVLGRLPPYNALARNDAARDACADSARKEIRRGGEWEPFPVGPSGLYSAAANAMNADSPVMALRVFRQAYERLAEASVDDPEDRGGNEWAELLRWLEKGLLRWPDDLGTVDMLFLKSLCLEGLNEYPRAVAAYLDGVTLESRRIRRMAEDFGECADKIESMILDAAMRRFTAALYRHVSREDYLTAIFLGDAMISAYPFARVRRAAVEPAIMFNYYYADKQVVIDLVESHWPSAEDRLGLNKGLLAAYTASLCSKGRSESARELWMALAARPDTEDARLSCLLTAASVSDRASAARLYRMVAAEAPASRQGEEAKRMLRRIHEEFLKDF